VISQASMAANLYVKDLSDHAEEVKATISTGVSINHVITIFIALFGGWIWQTLGIELLFILSAILGLCNSAYAATIRTKKQMAGNTSMMKRCFDGENGMIDFDKEHSEAWLELMAAYQDYRVRIFNWAKEKDEIKYRDLHMELSTPLVERDLHKRLLILNFLRSTDMWDEKAIVSVSEELTRIALQEQEEAAAYARMALKKIKRHPERMSIADQVLLLAEAEAKQENPDCEVFHNGCMLLFDLGCKEHLRRFIDAYKDFIYSASGLDEADLNELAESISSVMRQEPLKNGKHATDELRISIYRMGAER